MSDYRTNPNNNTQRPINSTLLGRTASGPAQQPMQGRPLQGRPAPQRPPINRPVPNRPPINRAAPNRPPISRNSQNVAPGNRPISDTIVKKEHLPQAEEQNTEGVSTEGSFAEGNNNTQPSGTAQTNINAADCHEETQQKAA